MSIIFFPKSFGSKLQKPEYLFTPIFFLCIYLKNKDILLINYGTM